MTCTGWDERLNAAHDGELGDADRAGVDAHVASCADCRRTLESLEALDRDLDLLRPDPSRLEDRLIAALRADQRPYRWWLPLFSAAAVLLAVYVALPPRRPPPPVGSLQLATGPVEINRGSAWSALPPGTGLRSGDVVRTSDGAKCEIAVADGSIVRLNGATEVVLQERRRLEVRRGEIFAKVAPSTELLRCTTDKMTVEAADATFNVSDDQVAVLEGRPAVHGTPSPVSAEPYLQTCWVHDLLKLKPEPNPETDLRVAALLAKLDPSKNDPYEREIRALGERSIPGLYRIATSSETGERRRTAAKLLTELVTPSRLHCLVALVDDRDADINRWAHESLTRLTGEKLQGGDAWTRWLREKSAVWGCEAHPPPKKP